MFKNQPKGLYVLALANTGERFGYYTMLAILLLFLQAKFALPTATAGTIYSVFLALVYFMPMVGGVIADRWNFSKTVTLGIFVMFLGYGLMAVPLSGDGVGSVAFFVMLGALLLIASGTGLFKGNLQVMVGDLYNDPRYSSKRDVAFSLFYMAINIGAMFAPMVTVALCNKALGGIGLGYDASIAGLSNDLIGDPAQFTSEDKIAALASFFHCGTGLEELLANAKLYVSTLTTGYSYAFAVACCSMVLSMIIYKAGRRTYAHITGDVKGGKGAAAAAPVRELTPQQTRSRITALLLVFVVVIFFWMVFHQNGLTLTKFAQIFTSPDAFGFTRIGFNIWALVLICVAIYSCFGFFQTKSSSGRVIPGLLFIGSLVGIYFIYSATPEPVSGLQPQIYQQFNPFYVVALTPFSVAIFSWLAKKKKEPSAPRKIGYGMLVAGVGFAVMAIGSIGLGAAPASGEASSTLVSPNWLMGTYLVLTFAELLLSPMGISFVSKVAPPKYKGMMMGCWFGATAIGNLLTAIPALLWDVMDVALIWVILICLCLVSALFIFSIMKKLEAATADSEAPAPKPDDDALETIESDAI